MIRAIGFDLDDTLLDHRGAASTAIAALLQKQGWVYGGAAEFGLEWQRIEGLHFANYIAGNLTLIEQRRERLRDFLALAEVEVRDAELDELFDEYLAHYANSWVAFPDARPTLDALHGSGFRLAVLTSGLQRQQEAKLTSLGFLDFFDAVLAIGTLSAPKPDARAFLELSSALGCPPHEVLYVGDDPHWDAIAATRAGLHGVWLNRDGRDTPEGVTTQVRTLASLTASVLDGRNLRIGEPGPSL